MLCREEAVFEQGERQMERLLTLQELAEDDVSNAAFNEVDGSEVMARQCRRLCLSQMHLHQNSHQQPALAIALPRPVHERFCGDRLLLLVACESLSRQASV